VLRPQPPTADLPLTLVQDLWVSAKADNLGLTIEEFTDTLLSVGAKVNYGLPVGDHPDAGQKAAFLRSLHLEELALARSCALGYDAAWKRFFHLYRAPLTQAAIAITGSPRWETSLRILSIPNSTVCARWMARVAVP